MEVASLAASLGSVLIAVIAIWLSITFYRLSTETSEATREAAKGIGASVERLEKIFDRLYSDTFSMMRDTVSDMRRHMWPERAAAADATADAEVEAKAEEKLDALRGEMERSIQDIVGKVGQADEKIQRLTGLMEHVMQESRRAEVEVRETRLRRAILDEMRLLKMRSKSRARADQTVAANDIVRRLEARGYRFTDAISELERMRDDRLIYYEGELYPDTEILPRRPAPPADERPEE